MLRQSLNRHKPLEVTCKVETLDDPRRHAKFYGGPGRSHGPAKSTETDELDSWIITRAFSSQ